MFAITTASPAEFNAMAFGTSHPGTIKFLEQHIQTATANLTGAAQQFFSKSYELFEKYNGAEALRIAANAARRIVGVFQADVIRFIPTIEWMQQATPVMQRYLMAEPEIRKMYHKGILDGFSNSYVDAEPDNVGMAHTDYRIATDGMIMEQADGDWMFHTSFDEPLAGEHLPTFDEKSLILSTWELARHLAKTGKFDPTSAYGNRI